MRAASPGSRYGSVRPRTLRRPALVLVALVGLAVLLAAPPASATVAIDWVTVSDPGNAAHGNSAFCIVANCGSVPYGYRISKYEVTNTQFVEFLNAKAASDPLGLYNTLMTSSSHGGITRTGIAGSYGYSVKVGMADKPVNYVSFYDSLRFANWLHNGQGNGDTETGAYTLLGGTATPSNGTTVARNPGAAIFLPSENEWFKAAYYDAVSTSYFYYPAGTLSNNPIVCSTPTATPNSANCNQVVDTVVDVGSYPNSPSPYGTFDQGGNVREWSDDLLGVPGARVVRGGPFGQPAFRTSAEFVNSNAATTESESNGIRLASAGFMQVAKLVAMDPAAGDQFGAASSISGDTMVVGAQRDDGEGDLLPESGSAYVFERNQGGQDDWGQVKKLNAPVPAAGDQFGASVAISGDTVVVGAYLDDSAGADAGAAYVFERNAGGADFWGLVATLTGLAVGDLFGVSVAISGDTIVVGAHAVDFMGTNSGSAYVFERNEGGEDNWGPVATLTASDAATDDLFGYSVSISVDTVVVGAFAEDSAGPDSDSGSAYVFERNQGTGSWGQVQKLTAGLDAGAGDFFGTAVSISGDVVVVGAHLNDDGGADSGSAYVFERNAGGADFWGQVKKLTPFYPGAGDFFGVSVSISVDTVAVGARDDDSGAGSLSGSAYKFERNRGGPDNWGELEKLTASDSVSGDRFGQSISISGDTIVVGAHTDDGAFVDAGAVYVFAPGGGSIWYELAKPVAMDPAAGDQFGAASSISGDTMVVGAHRDDGEDDLYPDSGSAYLFERNQGGRDDWGQVKKLTGAPAVADDQFGASVAISGDTVVVGAYLDDANGTNAGAAYVFQRNAGGADYWDQVKKLTGIAAGDLFGVSVAISGDTIVVGAHAADDGSFTDSGAAYVFERNEGGEDSWGPVATLTASDAATDDLFGYSVSISVDTVVVGAFAEDSAGPDSDSGSAYVFERNQGTGSWGQVKKLTAGLDAGAGDFFGSAVSISGDVVVVGASLNDDDGADSGSAYLFERNQGGEDLWGEVQKLTASDAGAGDFFGLSVSISVDTVAVGARDDDGGAGSLSGSAYKFERNRGGPDNWGELEKLTASDAASGDRFGQSISISGDTIVVGAHTEDDGGSDAGAVYVIPEPARGLMLAAGLALLFVLDRLRRRER